MFTGAFHIIFPQVRNISMTGIRRTWGKSGETGEGTGRHLLAKVVINIVLCWLSVLLLGTSDWPWLALHSRWTIPGYEMPRWGLPWDDLQSLSLLHLSVLIFVSFTSPYRRNRFTLQFKGSMESKMRHQSDDIHILLPYISFGLWVLHSILVVLFQNASLSIILRQKLIETIELSLQLPEERCHQGSFAFNHNPVLALKPWGLQANSGRCWFHRRETYSVLVNDSSSYATNSWPELLWKRLLRLWVNSCIIPGVRILEFQSEIACNITHSFFLYSFHVIIPNPKCKVPLSSPLSVDIVWSIVDRETAQAYTEHMH